MCLMGCSWTKIVQELNNIQTAYCSTVNFVFHKKYQLPPAVFLMIFEIFYLDVFVVVDHNCV